MRFDSLLTPVAEGDPCGPDLDEAGDEAYLNYVLAAGGRIPDSFYRRDPDAPINEPRYVVFDRSTIDLKAEVTAVAGLLERTRDIRLLTLEARFQALAGQVVGFCECIDAIADLIERYWEPVHPRGEDGDFTLRQNTIAGLDDQASILLPLAHAPFVVSKKIGAVSLRDYQIASGTVTARAEDREVALSDVMAALQEPPVRAGLDVLAQAIQGAERSLARMQRVFVDKAGYEYDPNVDNLRGVLKQMQGALATAIPELAAAAALEEAPIAAELPSAATAAAGGAATRPAANDIPSHQAADAALLAVQRYFVRYEPSSPAVILVHQARTLIGKPLAELLEMLLPGGVANARIELVKGSRFSLSMPELKQVTRDLLGDAGPAANELKLPDYTAKSRREVEDLLGRIEAFFRSSEPSTPVLMLLDRVKHFMVQDFSAIVTDILGNQVAAGARGDGSASSTPIQPKAAAPQPKPAEPAPQEAPPAEPAAPEPEVEAAAEPSEAPAKPVSAAASAVLQRMQRSK